MDDELDLQITAIQVELGLVPEDEQPTSSSVKASSLHSLIKHFLNSASTTKSKPTEDAAPNKPKAHQDESAEEEPDDLDNDAFLDLQIANATVELTRVRLEGDHIRYKRERQRQALQDNWKKKTCTLQDSIRRQFDKKAAPESWLRQIVQETFHKDDPCRNRFCLEMEIKNVHAIATMWWMQNQRLLQSEALDNLNQWLDSERTKLQHQAHTNRARMLVLLAEISPRRKGDIIGNLKLQMEQDYEAELEQQRLEFSMLNRQQHEPKEKEEVLATNTTTTTTNMQLMDHQKWDQDRLELSARKRKQLAPQMMMMMFATNNTSIAKSIIQLDQEELDQHRLEISILKRQQLLVAPHNKVPLAHPSTPSTTIHQLDPREYQAKLDQHRLEISILKRRQLAPKIVAPLVPLPSAPPSTTATSNSNSNKNKNKTKGTSNHIQPKPSPPRSPRSPNYSILCGF